MNIRRVLRRRRTDDIKLVVDLPSGLRAGAGPVSDRHHDVDAWVTRLVVEHRPSTSPGGERTAVAATPDAAAGVGEPPSPSGDTSEAERARVAEELLDDLAEILGVFCWNNADQLFTAGVYREMAERVLLAGWRPTGVRCEKEPV